MCEVKYQVPQLFMQVSELKWAFRAVIELQFGSTQSQSFLWPQLKKKSPVLL